MRGDCASIGIDKQNLSSVTDADKKYQAEGKRIMLETRFTEGWGFKICTGDFFYF